MKFDLQPQEVDLLIRELETMIQELRGLIASGMRKDLRDDIRKDKDMLMEIVVKIRAAAEAESELVQSGRAA